MITLYELYRRSLRIKIPKRIATRRYNELLPKSHIHKPLKGKGQKQLTKSQLKRLVIQEFLK